MNGDSARARPRGPGAVDGATHFGYSLRQYASATGLLGQIAARQGVDVPPPEPPYVDAEAEPATARIYHGKWITECPVPDCGDASFVWLATPLYLCANCLNETLGGRWRMVALPDDETARTLTDVLAHRALPQHRNWTPPETVDDLSAQNVEHGESVPEAT